MWWHDVRRLLVYYAKKIAISGLLMIVLICFLPLIKNGIFDPSKAYGL